MKKQTVKGFEDEEEEDDDDDDDGDGDLLWSGIGERERVPSFIIDFSFVFLLFLFPIFPLQFPVMAFFCGWM